MKELSIEQKAKAYDEALDYAHYLINERCKEGTNTSFHRADLDKMFPELKESEDEKIRKGIVKYFEKSLFGEERYCVDDDIVRDYIDWLEKQKPNDNVASTSTAWSEDDERIYKVILEILNSWSDGTIGGCIIPPNTNRYINWFKSLKDRYTFS